MAISGDYSNNDKKIYNGGTLPEVEVTAQKPKGNFFTDTIKKLKSTSAPDMLTASTAEILGANFSNTKNSAVTNPIQDMQDDFAILSKGLNNVVTNDDIQAALDAVDDPAIRRYIAGNPETILAQLDPTNLDSFPTAMADLVIADVEIRPEYYNV